MVSEVASMIHHYEYLSFCLKNSMNAYRIITHHDDHSRDCEYLIQRIYMSLFKIN